MNASSLILFFIVSLAIRGMFASILATLRLPSIFHAERLPLERLTLNLESAMKYWRVH